MRAKRPRLYFGQLIPCRDVSTERYLEQRPLPIRPRHLMYHLRRKYRIILWITVLALLLPTSAMAQPPCDCMGCSTASRGESDSVAQKGCCTSAAAHAPCGCAIPSGTACGCDSIPVDRCATTKSDWRPVERAADHPSIARVHLGNQITLRRHESVAVTWPTARTSSRAQLGVWRS